jgi:site-specific recombinase XerD
VPTLLYTGARVLELVNIKIFTIDLNNCHIKLVSKSGKKD